MSFFKRGPGVMLAFALAAGGCAPLTVGGIATGAVTAAQERSTGEALTDTEIKVRINNALLQTDASLFGQVSTDVTEGRVVLLGAVPNEARRQQAEEIALSVQDVRDVINELIVADRGFGDLANDARISNTVRFRLLDLEDVQFVNYSVETVNGVVHVMGLAQDAEELRKVTDAAARVSGVEQVVSHVLFVDDPRRRRDNT
ncbi:BON domain-containing protein [Pontivivens ytuae]|uniref:BON domain-containing protein n=1 Tax=Pontivivens ytuae TaxID=2789856 RepID=A0A7S9LP17_9RHOB|nr:BON domain-containing protein [Pontivivens ytuae]QPH52649.1 BON domain-containing protein [Pontivivens ytuae]